MTDTVSPEAAVEAEALRQLRSGFRGAVIEPHDAGYDEGRKVFNGMFDRRPGVILRPAGTADVIRAVGFARESGAPLAIRGGAHSVAGFSGCDGGIVIDMSAMKGIRVDPQARTVRAQAGLNWGEFDHETQSFGLATTGGRVTTTGVPGFTLGSGSGWLERKYGFACDNLVRADVVTASGDVVTATADENSDLFWGLCGGGGNFGVVTEMEFRLHQVGPIVYGGLMAFPPERAAEIARLWRDISLEAPEELGWALASVTAPPEPFVPEEWRGKRICGVAGMYSGDHDDATRVLQPLRDAKPLVDLWQPMPYSVVQGLLDGGYPYGMRNYWRAENVPELSEDVLDLYVGRGAVIPSPFTDYLLINLGGAISRVGEDDTALSGRDCLFNMHMNVMWENAEDDEQNIGWVRETTKAFAPYTAPGMALNFYTEIDEAALQSGFAGKLDRLRALKAEYDPTNLFRLNQNIRPPSGS